MLGFVAATSPAQAPKISEGKDVEVREGETWSPAKVVKKEGRKYQIEYDDGTEEWVTADRVRLPGTPAPKIATPDDDAPAETTTSAKPKSTKRPAAKSEVKIGQKVQAKWGGLWFDASIKDKAPNGWLSVQYDRHKSYEWVEPWRVRAVGSDADVPYARPNQSLRKPTAPPKEAPGPLPDDPHAAAHSRRSSKSEQEEAKAAELKNDPAFREADWSEAEPLDLFADGQKVTADPSPQSAKKLPNRPVVLRGAGEDHLARMTAVVVSCGEKPMAVVAHGKHGGGEDVKLERVDLAASKSRQSPTRPSRTCSSFTTSISPAS